MKKNPEKWTEAVLNSMEGARRASPPPGLLDRIEAQLQEENVFAPAPRKINWIAVAAAVLLLAVNGLAVYQYTQSSSDEAQPMAAQATTLVSDFDLYEL